MSVCKMDSSKGRSRSTSVSSEEFDRQLRRMYFPSPLVCFNFGGFFSRSTSGFDYSSIGSSGNLASDVVFFATWQIKSPTKMTQESLHSKKARSKPLEDPSTGRRKRLQSLRPTMNAVVLDEDVEGNRTISEVQHITVSPTVVPRDDSLDLTPNQSSLFFWLSDTYALTRTPPSPSPSPLAVNDVMDGTVFDQCLNSAWLMWPVSPKHDFLLLQMAWESFGNWSGRTLPNRKNRNNHGSNRRPFGAFGRQRCTQ